MRPLPLRPGFPVYGLSDAFAGFRWLLLWQRSDGPWEGHLTDVELGHGHPDDGPLIIVSTILKQPERVLADGGSIGPVGIEDAAAGAVWTAIEQMALSQDQSRALLESELSALHEDSGEHAFAGWLDATVSIDGVSHAARERNLGRSRAIIVEFPTLMITLAGPAASLLGECKIADVSECLNNYAAGRNDRAGQLLL